MDTEELILELIKMIKTLSPKLWSILLKQVRIDFYRHVFWGLLLTVSSIYGVIKGIKNLVVEYKKDYYEQDELVQGGYWALFIISCVLVVVGLILLDEAFIELTNPEFEVISYLLSKIE